MDGKAVPRAYATTVHWGGDVAVANLLLTDLLPNDLLPNDLSDCQVVRQLLDILQSSSHETKGHPTSDRL